MPVPNGVRFSHDGKWIAYSSVDSGRTEVCIAHFPDLNHKHQVSNGGASRPRWGVNDREIFYNQNVGGPMLKVASLRQAGEDLIPEIRRVFYEGPYQNLQDLRSHYVLVVMDSVFSSGNHHWVASHL